MNKKTSGDFFLKWSFLYVPTIYRTLETQQQTLHTRSVSYILAVQGKKVLKHFYSHNANDCPNILSHGATFRMGVLVPNYPEENVVKQGDKETGTSNVFQILQDLRIKQYKGNSEPKAYRPSTTFTTGTAKQLKV